MNTTPTTQPPEFETYPALTFIRNRKFEMADFAPMFDGTMMLPNFEPLPLWQVARMATSFYGKLHEGAYAKVEQSRNKSWKRALYMLTCGQGGGLTGEGYVIVNASFRSDETSVVAGRFTICKHKKVDGAGANHSRGWHPGHCEICGLDMTVDSGD